MDKTSQVHPTNLRQSMPGVTEFLDRMFATFGRQALALQIRKGLDGEPGFWAQENGVTVGTRLEIDPARCVSVADMVLTIDKPHGVK